MTQISPPGGDFPQRGIPSTAGVGLPHSSLLTPTSARTSVFAGHRDADQWPSASGALYNSAIGPLKAPHSTPHLPCSTLRPQGYFSQGRVLSQAGKGVRRGLFPSGKVTGDGASRELHYSVQHVRIKAGINVKSKATFTHRSTLVPRITSVAVFSRDALRQRKAVPWLHPVLGFVLYLIILPIPRHWQSTANT